MNTLQLFVVAAAAVFLLWAITAAIFHYIFAMKKQSAAASVSILKQKGTLPQEIAAPERLTVLSDNGFTLTGYYINQFPDAKRAVIIAHGYRSNHVIALQYAPVFIKNGYNVLVIDQRAHGESGGKFPSYGLYESRDLHHWVTLLRERLGEDCEIGLMGHSLGGATVLCYPKIDTGIRFIITDCTYATLRQFIIQRIHSYFAPAWLFYPLVNRMVRARIGFSMNEVNPIEVALREGLSIPTLFIHSKGDRIMSFRGTKEMYEKRHNPHDRLYLHTSADHADVYCADTSAYQQMVDAFLQNL